MQILLRIALNGIALLVAAYLVPGVSWNGGVLALLVAGAVLGLINCFVRPLAVLLSLPLLVLSLGLFYLVLNGAMFYLVSLLAPGLSVSGCLPAMLAALIVGGVNWIIGSLQQTEASHS